jgi:hypothetical protein
MKVMVLVGATPASEAGEMPSTEQLAEMGKFNEELVKAGVILAGEGLHDSSKGARLLTGPDGSKTMIDGPFTESKELIAGFWIWEVKSLDEAKEWLNRVPNPHNGEGWMELRQILEADDFGDNLTPELREQEAMLRAESAAKER